MEDMIPYADVKRAVLELIDQYSMAGQTVSLSYNNQSDAVHRIPNLLNHAFSLLHLSVHPFRRRDEHGNLVPVDTEQLSADPPDTWFLRLPVEQVQAAEYYAAAMLVLREDAFAYASLMNQFEQWRTLLSQRITVEDGTVEDVYGFNSLSDL